MCIGFFKGLCGYTPQIPFIGLFNKVYDSGHFPSQRIWKRIVHRSIFEYELKEWQQRINIDSDFNIFKKIHEVFRPHPAWTVELDFPYLR